MNNIEEIKKEFTDILVEFGKVVEDVAIAGVRNPVGFKPTHLWKPAYDRAIERLLETIPSHDEIKREAYILGYKAGWGDDVNYKTNAELEEQAEESYEGNKQLIETGGEEKYIVLLGTTEHGHNVEVDFPLDIIKDYLTQSKEGGE